MKRLILAIMVLFIANSAWCFDEIRQYSSLCEKREYAELKDMDESELIEAIRNNQIYAAELIKPDRTNNPEQGYKNGVKSLQCLAINSDYVKQLKKRYKYNDNKIKKLVKKIESEGK